MKTIALRDCCRFLSGGTPSKGKPEYWVGNVPWFSPKDIKSFDLLDSQDHISEAAVASTATHTVNVGAILVVARSGVLAHTLPVGVIRQRAAFNQDIKAILPNERFDADFVALFLRSRQEHVLMHGVKVGATVHSLKSGFLEALQIPDIDIREQRQVALNLKAQLDAVASVKLAAQAQLADINRLPARLLAQAFHPADEGTSA